MSRINRALLADAFPGQPRMVKAFEDLDKSLEDAGLQVADLQSAIDEAVANAGDIPGQLAARQPLSALLTALADVAPAAGVIEMAGSELFAVRPVGTSDGASLVTRDQLGGLSQPSVTGSRGGNAALASLLTALDTMGLITNSTTA